MAELTAKNQNEMQTILDEENPALDSFEYENGYIFSATDLGNMGVKVELGQGYDKHGAIILPPHKAEQCARWMLHTIGQKEKALPRDLPDILERLSSQKNANKILKRGDKTKIRRAIKVLKDTETKN